MSSPPVTLDRATRLALLKIILESRHGDLRQENLNRQGRGHFHVAGMGHEALAAIGRQLTDADYLCPYYRDRGLVMGRGVTTRDLARDYFAKRESSSHGRQMPAHFSYPQLKIWSVPTPTASQLLPACGMAWGVRLDGKRGVVVTTVGDAATRQGDFFEAVCFAEEKKLPLLLVVEDNAYGISTPTRDINPLALGALDRTRWQLVDGTDVELVHHIAAESLARLRAGGGPEFLWVQLERLTSHTSSDDQKIYRPPEEIEHLFERDPLHILKDRMIAAGELDADTFAVLDTEVKEAVRRAYAEAEQEENPLPTELEENVFNAPPEIDEEIFRPGTYRMGDTINMTLRAGLDADPRRVIFGEDVEDPKGGVFKLTKNLSTDFPRQVFNSPLAESTILGVACGLASYGRRPVFELQFIDFVYPGWNQLVSNLATLRWRTFGRWTCPCVIYAPYGAYLPGGSLWHSQANESAIAHFPGLNVVVPSTPEDAAGLLWTAMHAEDPVVFLIPKHLLWAEREVRQPIAAIPIGHARKRREGTDVTLVAWGNTMERALEALGKLDGEVSIDLIDLRSIVPWDREMIEESVRRTGRLVVVQEDTENCSVGQMIVSHLCGRPDVWNRLVSPPVLVSKGNVMIGYNPIYEYAALPDTDRVVAALRQAMTTTRTRAAAAPSVRAANPIAPPNPAASSAAATAAAEPVAIDPARVLEPVRVPIMGEGIRSARVVALLKKPGDAVKPDDALCEVETEKAVYPIEAAHAGTFVRWFVAADDTVAIGQVIGGLAPAGVDWREWVEAPLASENAVRSATAHPGADGDNASTAPTEAQAEPGTRREPALAPSITRRLSPVVPATIEMKALWAAIRDARAAAKEADPATAPSPSLMVAWCVTRAMERHPSFRRLVLADRSIREVEDFDLGVAVALEGDRLGTASIACANRLAWSDFAPAYLRAIDEVRHGRIVEVRAPLLITSLGGFGVRGGVPIVVPPAMATLFVGTAHHEMIRQGNSFKAVEVVTLTLTFDHCVVNGAGAAAFLQEVRLQMENFRLPSAPAPRVAETAAVARER